MMASKRSIIPAALECSICLQPFTDPRVLPCQHTFCLRCLEQWANKAPSPTSLPCPLCKSVIDISLGGVSHVKKNFLIEELMAELQCIDQSQTCVCSYRVRCRNKAVHLCTDGCGYMCENCLEDHKDIKATSKHNVTHLNADEKKSHAGAEKRVSCQKHPVEKLNLYCESCKITTCYACSLTTHRQHHVVELSGIAAICKVKLQTFIKDVELYLGYIEKYVKETSLNYQQFVSNMNESKQQVDNVVTELHRQLDDQRLALHAQLDNIYKKNCKVFQQVKESQKTSLTSLTGILGYSQNLLKNDIDQIMVDELKYVQGKFRTVSALHSVVWNPSQIISNDALNVGKIESNLDVSDMPANRELSTSGQTTLKKIPLPIMDMVVTGLVKFAETLWVVHIGQSVVWNISLLDNNKSQQHDINGLQHPLGMVEFPANSNQLVIGDEDGKKLFWVRMEKKCKRWEISARKVQNLKYSPCGLSTNQQRLLVGTMTGTFHILNSAGQHLQKFGVGDGACPYIAVQTTSGYVVRDYEQEAVLFLSREKVTDHIYKGNHNFCPKDIIADDNLIYVADVGNDVILCLQHDGSDMGELISKQHGISHPSRMYLDSKKGLLYVAHGNPRTGSCEVVVVELDTLQQVAYPALKQTTLNMNVTLHTTDWKY